MYHFQHKTYTNDIATQRAEDIPSVHVIPVIDLLLFEVNLSTKPVGNPGPSTTDTDNWLK